MSIRYFEPTREPRPSGIRGADALMLAADFARLYPELTDKQVLEMAERAVRRVEEDRRRLGSVLGAWGLVN